MKTIVVSHNFIGCAGIPDKAKTARLRLTRSTKGIKPGDTKYKFFRASNCYCEPAALRLKPEKTVLAAGYRHPLY